MTEMTKENLLDFGLKNSTVVLAGAFQGVGFELAKLLVACNANLLLIGRTKKNALSATKILKKLNPTVDIQYQISDLYIKKNRVLISKKIKKTYPQGIQHFVSFIGTGKTSFGTNISLNEWKDVFEKNFFSVVDLVNLFLPSLKISNKGNSIIITSAIAGLERMPAPQSYSCSKAALSSFIPHLAHDLSKDKIRVIGINPGNIYFKNGRWEQIVKEQGISKIKKNILSKVAMKRFGLADEIAWGYLMAISPRNSFMTGTNIIIDGQQVNKTI